jgi:signal transduction histidine kinase
MNRSTRSELRGSASLVGFLLLALVIAAVLAYQAQDAARSHRDTAERTLAEYASFASWQFARQADMALIALQMMALRVPVTVEGAASAADLPPVGEVKEVTEENLAWCRCLDEDVVFFRYLPRDRSLGVAGVEPRMLDALVEEFSQMDLAPDPETFAFGRAPLREDRTTPYAFQTQRSAVRFDGGEQGASRVALYYVVHDAEERPLAIYGMEADAGRLLSPIFGRIMEETPLLPSALTADLPNDSMLTVAAAVDGRAIFRSGDQGASGYTSRRSLEEPWQEVAVLVDLRPETAERLIIGGLPASRLPLLLGLLGLTAALMIGALVQLHRHQELVRTRANFVAGVSHELRTPLTQIRLYADLLRSGRLSQENHERSVRVIDQEARRLSHLVENILRFSSADALTTRLQPEPRQLAPLVREILRDFEPLARARRTEFRVELDPEARAAVDVDGIRQVLLNLLDNAVKYGPPEQEVVVGLDQRDGTVRIQVDDQGPGVPQEARNLVWEPYRRLEAAVESGMGGSGIGLSVVREIAELHGGRAWVTDAPGGGARFVIELPAAAARSTTQREMETV